MKKQLFSFALSLSFLLSSASALTIEQARSLVETLYIDPVSEEVLSRPTVSELFDGLDRYSGYFTPEEYQRFLSSMNDVSQVGLGIVSSRTEDGSQLVIQEVLPNGAAENAGVLPGDRITAIDDHQVLQAADMDELVGWMQGEEGTTVTLSLLRADGQETVLTLIRAPFSIPYTTHQKMDDHIGYIDCDSFGEETYAHFEEAVDDLDGETSLWLVDLRGNTGGLTQAAADVAGLFSEPGPQVLLQGRDGKVFAFSPQQDRTLMDPVILMVDPSTASSSELMAASIRDSEGGLILGTRTYGKGVAQTVVDQRSEPTYFLEGDAVRITSARFYSPQGVCNDKIGVFPHLMVSEANTLPIAQLLSAQDPGLSNEGYLRVHAASWQWYVSLEQALDPAFRSAFVELLEALWPDAVLYMGHGSGNWESLTPPQLAQRLGLEEYRPRTFADAADSPHQYALNVLGTYGILQGDEQGLVQPKTLLTRADLCTMLARLLRVEAHESSPTFADVSPTAWYASSVRAMAELGLVTGDEKGLFHPEAPLTYEQMIVILSRFSTRLNLQMKVSAQQAPQADSLPALSGYHPWAAQEAWLLGLSQLNLFGSPISYLYAPVQEIPPQAPASRENAAASLFRILTLLGGLQS